MSKMEFTRIAKFKFDNNYYQMFKTSTNKLAFLRITDDGKYHYPTIKEFTNLIFFFTLKYDDNKLGFKNGTHKKYSFLPKIKSPINKKVVLIALTSNIILSILNGCGANDCYARTYSYDVENYTSSNKTTGAIYETLKYEDNDSSYENEYDDIIDTEDLYANLITGTVELYNHKYFDRLFGVHSVSIEDVTKLINKNKKISKEYKDFMINFANTLDSYYATLDFRIFNENLKTIKFDFRSESDACFFDGSLAKYDPETNTMILMENIDLANDPKARLIFRHELWHMFNNLKITKDGYNIEYHFYVAGRGLYLSEALDVIYSTAPFLDDYPDELKENMGYPITSNIVRVLLESMNYEVNDSIDYNVYKFQEMLGKTMSNDIDPEVIEELIEIQWMEYETNQIEVSEDDYRDLYEYVGRLYINSNLSVDMSYEDIMKSKEMLVDRLLLGVKDPSYVYIDVIENEFNIYIQENNIQKNLIKR